MSCLRQAPSLTSAITLFSFKQIRVLHEYPRILLDTYLTKDQWITDRRIADRDHVVVTCPLTCRTMACPTDPAFLRVLSLLYMLVLQSPTWFPNLRHLNCSCAAVLAVFLYQSGTKPALWGSTIVQFPGRQTTNKEHSKSLESPSGRTLRKTHLKNHSQVMNKQTAVRSTRMDCTIKALLCNVAAHGPYQRVVRHFLNCMRVLYLLSKVQYLNYFKYQGFVGKSCPFSPHCQAS